MPSVPLNCKTSNSVLVNPLPFSNLMERKGGMWKGRLCDDGLITELYNYLWMAAEKYPDTVRKIISVPDTILYERGFPKAWYSWEKSTHDDGELQLRKHLGKDITMESIMKKFCPAKHTFSSHDVVAEYITMERKSDETPTIRAEYFTSDSLASFLSSRAWGGVGILQRFVTPLSMYNTTYEVVWAQECFTINQARSLVPLMSTALPILERCATFDGDSTKTNAFTVQHQTKDRLLYAVGELMKLMHTTEGTPVSGIVLYCKIDTKGLPVIQYCTSIRSRTGEVSGRDPIRVGVDYADRSAVHSRVEERDDGDDDQRELESPRDAEKSSRLTLVLPRSGSPKRPKSARIRSAAQAGVMTLNLNKRIDDRLLDYLDMSVKLVDNMRELPQSSRVHVVAGGRRSPLILGEAFLRPHRQRADQQGSNDGESSRTPSATRHLDEHQKAIETLQHIKMEEANDRSIRSQVTSNPPDALALSLPSDVVSPTSPSVVPTTPKDGNASLSLSERKLSASTMPVDQHSQLRQDLLLFLHDMSYHSRTFRDKEPSHIFVKKYESVNDTSQMYIDINDSPPPFFYDGRRFHFHIPHEIQRSMGPSGLSILKRDLSVKCEVIMVDIHGHCFEFYTFPLTATPPSSAAILSTVMFVFPPVVVRKGRRSTMLSQRKKILSFVRAESQRSTEEGPQDAEFGNGSVTNVDAVVESPTVAPRSVAGDFDDDDDDDEEENEFARLAKILGPTVRPLTVATEESMTKELSVAPPPIPIVSSVTNASATVSPRNPKGEGKGKGNELTVRSSKPRPPTAPQAKAVSESVRRGLSNKRNAQWHLTSSFPAVPPCPKGKAPMSAEQRETACALSPLRKRIYYPEGHKEKKGPTMDAILGVKRVMSNGSQAPLSDAAMEYLQRRHTHQAPTDDMMSRLPFAVEQAKERKPEDIMMEFWTQ